MDLDFFWSVSYDVGPTEETAPDPPKSSSPPPKKEPEAKKKRRKQKYTNSIRARLSRGRR